MQTVAPSGSGNYPQNPTNLRVELRKLNFVAKKYWHNVSRVKSQGVRAILAPRKGCPGLFPLCTGAALARAETTLPWTCSPTPNAFNTWHLTFKSALLNSSEQSHTMVCQKQNKLLGEYRQIQLLGIWKLRH